MSSIECEDLEEGAKIYADRCGDTSPYHLVYLHDPETFDKVCTIKLAYIMSSFKTIEVTYNVCR